MPSPWIRLVNGLNGRSNERAQSNTHDASEAVERHWYVPGLVALPHVTDRPTHYVDGYRRCSSTDKSCDDK
jgi:hypothetical protein